MYVYIKSEKGLYTVGHYSPATWTRLGASLRDSEFVPESDYTGKEDAAHRVHYLNGGN
jgi:hypothetical protein